MVKKITKFLEQNVQWIALGIGVLFMLYMAYLYVPPISKPLTIGGQATVVTPGSVDKLIADSSDVLKAKMNQMHPEFKVEPKIPSDLAMGPGTASVIADARPIWDAPAFDVETTPANGQNQNQQVVQVLPTLPAVKYVDNEPLRTVLATPPVNGAANGGMEDVDSITTFWALPVGELADQYKAAFGGKLPETMQTVLFVHAELVRQERLAEGKWGLEQVMAPAFNVPLPPVPFPGKAGPGAQQQFQQYKAWVQGNVGMQQWFVAATFPPIAIDKRDDLTWKSLVDWIPYRATWAATEAVPVVDTPLIGGPPPAAVVAGGAGAGGAAPAPVAGGAAGGIGIFDATDPGFAKSSPVVGAIRQVVAPPLAGAPAAAALAPAGANPGPAPAPVVVIPPIPKLQAVPAAAFNPGQLPDKSDMEFYFHDLTVVPGKTYQYKVRYTIFNPVYDQPKRVAKNKLALTSQFGIDSPDSAWSDAITVEPRTRFWLAGSSEQPKVGAGKNQVKFAVFTWRSGFWQYDKDAGLLSTGDEIGSNEADKGDFTTHWTLLDLKEAPAGDSQGRDVLVVPDDGGATEERDSHSDVSTQQYKRFVIDYNNQAGKVGG